ncbi:hypothetical protein AVHY2522_00375 [Acidovorax sp. SUPP2522]|uniref:hypothetical protein n=1 Tax=unclassified Acidovorax TaxID=2684926 RepID=UPI00234A0B71|nr:MULTISPECIES: hypothetical protein [unclassified Acidovorax]WCM97662.1 hypothetical protein M5C96_25340 [Acidovorax sp. GBBC 1281]GKS84014.1 hypothetical protein AVMA1855_07700 [Acidovorax sp. SUPP1855]GKT13251.1 hypothetical protein AVHY2522_00375 [Acidovorax sp. SUPP2522]
MTLHPLLRTSLMAAALAAATAHAQLPPPPPGGPGPLAQAPAAEQSATASGRLQRWLPNPNGEADGLLLQDGTQIAFPPHLSESLTAWLRPGDPLEVTGWHRPDAPVLRAETFQSQGRTVQDTPPTPGQRPPPPPREALTALQANGRVAQVLFNSRGDAHGLLLEDGVVVRFPPHMGTSVAALLKPGATVAVRGWGTRNALGTGMEAAQMGATPDTLQDMLGGPIGAPALRP